MNKKKKNEIRIEIKMKSITPKSMWIVLKERNKDRKFINNQAKCNSLLEIY